MYVHSQTQPCIFCLTGY